MELIFQNVWLVLVLPLLAAILSGLGLFFLPTSIKYSRRICFFVSVLSLGIAVLISSHSFWQQITGSPIRRCLWSWVIGKNLSLEMGYLIDPLTSIMLVLVTTVGVLVMIYSGSYMSHDQGYSKFFCYLSLFTASMLGLVISPNLVQIYIFWELVGMCSYLLIGFWFTRPSAADACQKAFVVNRVGDSGSLVGILGFYWITGSFEFQDLSERFFELFLHDRISPVLASFCAALFLLGSVAKSAQFPLHIWLPDAMEGPTPISALIHAATMVAAGIFLVARMFPLFEMLPSVMDTIAWTGAITALLGASFALAQKDLKKGLAYSTMSQLGYMMLALGIGSYRAGLFHLVTHAYSKALLFLGSGSVIHSMEPIVGYHPIRSQNMFFMGGLRKQMPITSTTFLFGTLSLCGIPPFACFWSKDETLAASWLHFPFMGVIASYTAGLTAFHMFRIYLSTFEGDFRGHLSNKSENIISLIPIWGNVPYVEYRDENPLEGEMGDRSVPYPKESDSTMLFSLIVLAIPTLFIGFIGVIPTQQIADFLSHWLSLSISSYNDNPEDFSKFLLDAGSSIGIALVGASVAFYLYGNGLSPAIIQEPGFRSTNPTLKYLSVATRNWSYHRGYIDGFYNSFFVRGLRLFVKSSYFMDQWIVDGIVNGTGISSFFMSEVLKHTGGGRISSYLFILVSCMFLSLLYSYII
uniref:NADH-plastoquinone oxidoreductase subunit 5 n=1 Tax=Fossombronia foveolata TaxID=56918 RepID=UPI00257A9B55|nr:NADH-plastoquinone oxidoreductase subunit 5 [Fossombronia foveolata]WIA67256.1 NADH-plastoquinone oxidoreductase subunit 5 [Fossombronia foveolata]